MDELRSNPSFYSIVASRLKRTPAIGGPPGQTDFWNAAIRFQTEFDCIGVHQRLIAIEQGFGRTRTVRWGDRIIDLDLLLVGHTQYRSGELTVPHPRMSFRRFVLEPAREIAAEMIHPPSSLTIQQLCEQLDRRPDRIMIVGDDAERLWKSIDSGRLLLQWKVIWVNDIDRYHRERDATKLVVIAGSGEAELLSRARKFAGSTLDLANVRADQFIAELTAAADAMN
jgi:2-amino-4-hydroxy-6-hydroxymethyldihydropteridine diphosphokinase